MRNIYLSRSYYPAIVWIIGKKEITLTYSNYLLRYWNLSWRDPADEIASSDPHFNTYIFNGIRLKWFKMYTFIFYVITLLFTKKTCSILINFSLFVLSFYFTISKKTQYHKNFPAFERNHYIQWSQYTLIIHPNNAFKYFLHTRFKYPFRRTYHRVGNTNIACLLECSKP